MEGAAAAVEGAEAAAQAGALGQRHPGTHVPGCGLRAAILPHGAAHELSVPRAFAGALDCPDSCSRVGTCVLCISVCISVYNNVYIHSRT